MARHRRTTGRARHRRGAPASRRLVAFLAVLAVLPVAGLTGAGRTTAAFSGTEAKPATLTARSAFYADAVVALAPVSYWRLGEASGTVGADVMNVAPLTYVGLTLGQPGMNARDADTSIRWVANGDHALAAETPALRLANFTVIAWLKTATFPQPNIARVITRNDGTHFNYHLSWNGPGTAMRFLTDTTTGRFEAVANVPGDYQWHMHVGTFDGSQLRLYRDGAQVNAVATTGTARTPAGSVSLGASGVNNTKGLIDEVAIFPRALSQPEIAGLYTWATT
jgi:hypothetical protein